MTDIFPPTTEAVHKVYPPELYEIKQQLPDAYYDYLEYVLRSINYTESYTGIVNGRSTIYYILDKVVNYVQEQLTLVEKNEVDEYPMPIQRYRSAVLRELRKYIRYFTYVASEGRIPIESHQQLFDGID